MYFKTKLLSRVYYVNIESNGSVVFDTFTHFNQFTSRFPPMLCVPVAYHRMANDSRT